MEQGSSSGSAGSSWNSIGAAGSGKFPKRSPHCKKKGKHDMAWQKERQIKKRDLGRRARYYGRYSVKETEKESRIRSMITLRIPHKVIEKMTINLQNIEEVARNLKISIIPVKSLKVIKLESAAVQSFDEAIQLPISQFYTSFENSLEDSKEQKKSSDTSIEQTKAVDSDIYVKRELNESPSNTSYDFEQPEASKKPKIEQTEVENPKKICEKDEENISWELNNIEKKSACSKSSELEDDFKKPNLSKKCLRDSSTAQDFIPLNTNKDFSSPSMAQNFIPLNTKKDLGDSSMAQDFISLNKKKDLSNSSMAQNFIPLNTKKDLGYSSMAQDFISLNKKKNLSNSSMAQDFIPLNTKKDFSNSSMAQDFISLNKKKDLSNSSMAQNFIPLNTKKDLSSSSMAQDFISLNKKKDWSNSSMAQDFIPLNKKKDLSNSSMAQNFIPLNTKKDLSSSSMVKDFIPLNTKKNLSNSSMAQDFIPLNTKKNLGNSSTALDFILLNINKDLSNSSMAQNFIPLNTKKDLSSSSMAQDFIPLNTKKNLSNSSMAQDFIPLNTKKNLGNSSTALDFIILNINKDLSNSSMAQNFIPLNTKKDLGHSSKEIDFIHINTEAPQDYGTSERVYSLRGGGDYKYGYQDIITGTFDEKLDECLSKGVAINRVTNEIKDLNVALYQDYQDMKNRNGSKKMMGFRQTLPTYKKTQELLDVIQKNQVIVISGETGCGKSTQVPQLILDDAICNGWGANCNVVVTQPRRIAASSLAKRVSEERGEPVGQTVGYAVRLEKIDPRPRGSIMFVTTGILLADLEVNQSLTNYSHVILDEVHERDCHIDLSMCLLKKVLKKRKDLKLILMSATIDANTLSKYFDDCPMMHIEGLAYPVKDVYLEEIIEMTQFELPPEGRGLRPSMEKVIQYRAEVGPWLETIKHQISLRTFGTLLDLRIETLNHNLIFELLRVICSGPPGAILVFLPGIGAISKLVRMMENSGMFPRNLYQIYPLHSKLPSLEQHQIFERPPGDVRKIIIATNIAETSITIDDIVYVVDCAKIKITGLQVEDNIQTLNTEWVSQANLRQRRGRSGRCQPGICYHLVTTFRAAKLDERLLPELQRSNLLEPVLTIKRLRLGDAETALKTVMSPPNPSTVRWAVRHLQQIGALDAKETLTPLGWHLARLPVHPSAGKLLLLGSLFGCLDRAASVAAVWGFKDPFQMVIGKEDEVEAARRRLALGEPSDQVAISEAIIQWERQGERQKEFAYEYFLSNNTLELLSDMKTQLGDSLKQMGFLATGDVKSSWENRNSENLSLFKAIVAASLYPNFAMVKWKNLNKYNLKIKLKPKQVRCTAMDPQSQQTLAIHPSSVMALPPNQFGKGKHYQRPLIELCNNPGANWLVYWLKQKTTSLYIFEVTLVYTLPLLFFAEVEVVDDEDFEPSETDCVLSISGVKVRCTTDTADLLYRFRSLLDQVLASKVGVGSSHATRRCDFEELVLNAVIELITAEDEGAEYLGDDDSEPDASDYDNGPKQWS